MEEVSVYTLRDDAGIMAGQAGSAGPSSSLGGGDGGDGAGGGVGIVVGNDQQLPAARVRLSHAVLLWQRRDFNRQVQQTQVVPVLRAIIDYIVGG
eukprot:31664-Eustigmatos_ZCMA.PRE.1